MPPLPNFPVLMARSVICFPKLPNGQPIRIRCLILTRIRLSLLLMPERGFDQEMFHVKHLLQDLLLKALDWYHLRISPNFSPRCKYFPTCSQYMEIAIRRFGAARGLLLGILRLLRCQPWVQGGIDDVPHVFSLFYRFRWSKAYEKPTTRPIITYEQQSRMI